MKSLTVVLLAGLALLALGGELITATPLASATPSAPGPAYPLQVSANGRYLVDQLGSPFMIVGDSPQALIGDVSEQDADVFLADRQTLGINTVWVNLVCNDYTGCKADGSTFDGIPPFIRAGDLSTPNDQYFSRADRIIKLAGARGINVLLDPIETGGWLNILKNNGKDKAYTYGLFLGKRYKDVPNIIWMSGNDFQSWRTPADDALVLAVAQGIKDAGATQLQTVELDFYVSSSLDDASWAPSVQLEAAYTYQPTYAEVLKDYNRKSFKPVFMVEANYELEHDYTGPATLRRQEWWSLLSGATGQLYGNRYSWQFATDWKSHIDTVGATQLAYLAKFSGSRRWFDLVPDQQHTLVTGGFGTFSSSGSVNDSDYVTAAMTPDGSLGVAYVPSARTVTVDMSRFAGPAQVRWYDPSNDSYIPVTDSPFANVGTRELLTPGRNSGGDGDWVLVLELAQ